MNNQYDRKYDREYVWEFYKSIETLYKKVVSKHKYDIVTFKTTKTKF